MDEGRRAHGGAGRSCRLLGTQDPGIWRADEVDRQSGRSENPEPIRQQGHGGGHSHKVKVRHLSARRTQPKVQGAKGGMMTMTLGSGIVGTSEQNRTFPIGDTAASTEMSGITPTVVW